MADVTVWQATSLFLKGSFRDDQNVKIPLASLTAVTYSILVTSNGNVINSKNAVDGKNANNMTIDSAGNYTLELLPADNPINDVSLGANATEEHTVRIEWTFNAGARAGCDESSVDVKKKLVAVP